MWGLWCAVSSYCLAFHVYEGRGDRWEHESETWYQFWNLGERVILGFVKLIPTDARRVNQPAKFHFVLVFMLRVVFHVATP